MEIRVQKGLCIQQPWVGMIAEGNKTWEMRTMPFRQPGWYALIETGRKDGKNFIHGIAEFKECKGPLAKEDLLGKQAKHGMTNEEVRELPDDKENYAWQIGAAVKFKEPIPYKIKNGVVTWSRLDKDELIVNTDTAAFRFPNRRNRA